MRIFNTHVKCFNPVYIVGLRLVFVVSSEHGSFTVLGGLKAVFQGLF